MSMNARGLDPAVERALQLLEELPVWRRAGAHALGHALAEDLAGRLLAEALPRYGWLDVGLWGRPVYLAAAEAALRLWAVAVTGDELE